MTRESASTALPTGTLTFFFSDIEGSTRLLQHLGEGFPALLEKHAAIIRALLPAHGGVEVATEGDSFFLVFPSALGAVAVAAGVHRALARETWPDGISVCVRIGLHTGEGLLVGDNYGGLDVHRAARIAGVGHGGQTILSASTAALVQGSLPAGTSLLDLGAHRLKDLVSEERLFQLTVDELRAAFPPIRSLGSRPNNLPVEITSFIGREREIGDILELLERERLVTLTGPGGTGKTRLSLQAGARSLESFPDGVFFVPLAPISDAALVPSTIAEALGVKEEKEKSAAIERTLLDYVRDKTMLLVLDNFEQILHAAGAIGDLLLQAPSLKVLVTSRAPLRISGENEYSVPPMVLPDPKDLPSVSLLLGYESVALFVQRAAAVKTGFTLTEENAPAVVTICHRLDGLPLALELAAARMRILTAQAIGERLESRLRLLTGGGRDLPERQQTLRGAIDWSYDLLDETLRVFFCRLAVFVNGFSIEAAEEICNPGDELGTDTLDALSQLVDNSLVRQTETLEGEPRFRLLQVIREYAQEKLQESGDGPEIEGRHVSYFAGLVEKLERDIARANPRALTAVDDDHDNLRAVMAWSLQKDLAEPGLRVGAAMWRYWMMRSHLAEGRAWLTRLLALPSAAPRNRLRARALDAEGSIAYWQNDLAVVRPLYEEALEVYRELGDEKGIADETYNLGFSHALSYDDDKALSYLKEARERFRTLGEPDRETDAIWGWSWLSLVSGRYPQSREAAEEALGRYQAAGNSFGVGSCHLTLSRLCFAIGDMQGAWEYLEKGLSSFTDVRDLGDISSILKHWSNFELAEGRPHRGAVLWGAASALEERFGGGAPDAIARVTDPTPELLTHMSPAEVDAAMSEGASLSVEEAIAFARKRE